jgi:hypothetical protein
MILRLFRLQQGNYLQSYIPKIKNDLFYVYFIGNLVKVKRNNNEVDGRTETGERKPEAGERKPELLEVNEVD